MIFFKCMLSRAQVSLRPVSLPFKWNPDPDEGLVKINTDAALDVANQLIVELKNGSLGSFYAKITRCLLKGNCGILGSGVNQILQGFALPKQSK
ncbi:hypothetical protein ACOSQ3_017624 [Xanthoceras sorbifolium]